MTVEDSDRLRPEPLTVEHQVDGDVDGPVGSSGASELVTQAADLQALRPLAVAYADAYQALIAALLQRAEASESPEGKAALSDLWRMLTLDTVTVAVIDHRGRRRHGRCALRS